MNIKKIKPLRQGIKGMYVEYINVDENGKVSDLNKITFSHPTHMALELKFKDLRPYLLELTEIFRGDEEQMEKDYAVAETKVTEVIIEGSNYSLVGKKKTRYGNKEICLETAMMDFDDEYLNHESVIEIIEQIVEETKLYMQKKVVVAEEELITRYVQAGGDKKMSNERYESLGVEEKLAYHTKILEDVYGCVVNHSGDFSIVNEEELEKAESELLEIKVDGEEVIIPAAKPKTKKAKSADAPTEEEAF